MLAANTEVHEALSCLRSRRGGRLKMVVRWSRAAIYLARAEGTSVAAQSSRPRPRGTSFRRRRIRVAG